jgi:hypothetical protein
MLALLFLNSLLLQLVLHASVWLLPSIASALLAIILACEIPAASAFGDFVACLLGTMNF